MALPTYLNSRGVLHRDLKPENVLLTEMEDVKLADFSLAREYTALKTDTRLDDDSWPGGYTQYYMDSEVGTPFWVAAEVFDHDYTEKADVFSLGVLFCAILEGDFIELDGKKVLRRVQAYFCCRQSCSWICDGNIRYKRQDSIHKDPTPCTG